MDRVQARGRVGFKIKLSEGLGMLTIVSFSCIYSAALQASVTPLSPHRRATEGSGNTQGRNMGLPKRSHTALSPLGWSLELSGFCSARQGTLTPIRRFPHSGPNPAWPWPWLPVTTALQTVQGQRLTQQPHIRHGSSPLCQCWMVNRPKISLLECVTEFRQRRSRQAWNEIMVIQWQ